MHYFGTTLNSSGHFFFELEGNSIHRAKRQYNLSDLPFNPEGLPYPAKRNGYMQFHQYCGFTILAITGSCHDTRSGSKSVFFVEEIISQDEMKARILSIPIAKQIIEKMPFKVEW